MLTFLTLTSNGAKSELAPACGEFERNCFERPRAATGSMAEAHWRDISSRLTRIGLFPVKGVQASLMAHKDPNGLLDRAQQFGYTGVLTVELFDELQHRADVDVSKEGDGVGGDDGEAPIVAASSMQIPVRDSTACPLYTSDAADDMQCVDLGGRGIIKKKIHI